MVSIITLDELCESTVSMKILNRYISTIKYITFFENKNSFVTFATEIPNPICYYINKVKEHKVTDTK